MADLIDRDAIAYKVKSCITIPADNEWDSGYNTAMAEAKQYIQNAPAVNSWILCSEKLPNESGEYLVCGRWNGEKPKTWICQFIMLCGIGGFTNSAKNPPISFWMPIPDAYESPEVTQDDER
jgi:hypothetical protein